MKNFLLFICIVQLFAGQTYADNPPQIVGIPPADGGRGLVRVSENEIRHYSGAREEEGRNIIVSRDNGMTWEQMKVPETYPPNFGGMYKESPAIVQNPITGEFIRVQPVRGHLFISQGGIDGKWGAVTKDGKLCFDWATSDPSQYISLSGIRRTPTFVDGGKRILIPAHDSRDGTYIHISDDRGLTWSRSKNNIPSPPQEVGGVHKGHRWQNIGVEGTIVELNDGLLWILVRTSQDQHWESFSSDYGETWSPAQPSRFWGTLTMPTISRLADGRLLLLWTNTTPLPENKAANRVGGEDAFTNRDSHHAAISHDEGKTWVGFREIILDEHRNRSDYATFNGPQDRGKHQSEMVQLDENRVLVSLGQHKEHRRLVVFDTRMLYETERSNYFENGLDDWTIHTYIPVTKGHCAYDRKPSVTLVDHKGKKSMLIKRLDDNELTNEEYDVNYEKAGATWNFPNGTSGVLSITFTMNKGSGGTQLSLTDRLFNACDETTEKFAVYTMSLKPGMKLGNRRLRAGKSYTLTLKWNGVKGKESNCKVFVGKSRNQAVTLPVKNPSPNGLSYIHLISNAENPDTGVLIHGVEAKVNGKSVADPPSPKSTLNVFVLTGQSNSLGIIKDGEPLALTNDPVDKNIRFFWMNRDPRANIVSTSKGKIEHLQVQMFDNGHDDGHWGLEMSCARNLYKAGITDVMFIKVSRGGGGSAFWYKNSEDSHMFQAVIETVTDAANILRKQNIAFKLRGLLYLQGESDGADSHIADKRARTLLDNLRIDLPEAKEMKMYIGGIAGFNTNQALVRKKHEALAETDPDVYYINTEDLLQSQLYNDRLHFNNQAKLTIGERFAEVIMNSVGEYEPCPITGSTSDMQTQPISKHSSSSQELKVSYPGNCFANNQKHKLEGLVVQDAIVHLPIGNQYKLEEGSGIIRGNHFIADKYGLNIIHSSSGKTYSIFNHFSSVKIAGGEHEKLRGEYIDRIQDIADLLRFHPGIGKTDPEGPMAKGPHTTVEPRMFVDSRGIFYSSYHVKDHTFRSDAPAGMGLVVSVSFDNGNTWEDTWYENHRNGVLGYPAFCEYEGTVHLYFNGSHPANPGMRHWQGVQRITTRDGRKWTPMERIDNLNKLLVGQIDGNATCITQNALTIPDMQWKVQRGTAILIPHYNGKIVISMDGGITWDYFFQGDNWTSTKSDANLMDELSLELTKDSLVYVISRSELKHELNFQYLIDLKGNLVNKWQETLIATWCSHGTEVLPDHRIMYSTTNGQYRNNAAIGITKTPQPNQWTIKQLYTGGGCGYSDVCWSPADSAILFVAECGPILGGKFLDTPAHFLGGNDPERLSIRLFKFSELYFQHSLPLAQPGLIPWTGRVRQSRP